MMITLGIVAFIISGVGQIVTLSQLNNEDMWCKHNLLLMLCWLGLFCMGIAGLSLIA